MQKIFIAVLFLFILLQSFAPVNAATTATTTLSGGTSISADYNSNENRTPDNEKDRWGSSANAFLSLNHSRLGEKGGLSLKYGTNFKYDFKDETSSWSDHSLYFNGWRSLSKHLRFNLSDSFVMTNDLWGNYLSSAATGIPDKQDNETTDNTTPQAEATFSERIGQEKFWSNSVSTSLAYEYARTGTVTIGYNNRILEYDEPGNDNYKRNKPSISISYGFSPRWSSSLSYSYTDANFDITEDFTTHVAGLSLGYIHSVQDSFSAGLNYSETNYETLVPATSTDLNDNYTVSTNLGWTHAFSPTQTLEMSAGPSYNNEDSGEDRTTANFNVRYTSIFENGSWFVGANGGFADRSFNGDDAGKGLSENQSIVAGVGWQVAKDLSANLGARIRSDDFLQNPLANDEKTYNATASLLYRFSRWFYISGRYGYTQSDADLNANDYAEHRFFITLGASKELYRWIH